MPKCNKRRMQSDSLETVARDNKRNIVSTVTIQDDRLKVVLCDMTGLQRLNCEDTDSNSRFYRNRDIKKTCKGGEGLCNSISQRRPMAMILPRFKLPSISGTVAYHTVSRE